ncbi:DUF2232 domain-containing protein [Telmatospirillum sp.]|uniref:DUF2232 domain-containing protein n=1 Tax=Telmatospirillum sp. TaxID=2079197 RepID=UPI00284474CD|nr:DUF2232 domain-containing protein [Telmatospirillum sp.]MDR3437198.1 DUF2232 domain-containing protein [Telmatospirillum sp.]
MSKDLGLSVAAGLASALVFLSVLTGGGMGVLLAYLMPLPLVMIGFSRGLWQALLAAAVALVAVAVVAPSGALAFAATTLLPTGILVPVVLRRRQAADGRTEWHPVGSLLAWLALVAVVVVVAGTSLTAAQGTGFEDQARAYVTQVLDQVAPQAPPDMRSGAIALWSALFPAMLGCGWLLMVVLNGLLAQWIVAKAGQASRPTPAYAEMELPLWSLAILAVAVLVGVTIGGNVGYLARNAAVILIVPQTLAGLTVVHRTLRGRPNRGVLLALFYVVFFVMFGWSLVAVAGLGLVRHWTRLRRRQVESSQEEK